MSFENLVYYCSECKKILTSSEELLVVEDNGAAAFCSEECVETYYAPLVHYYGETDHKMRKAWGLTKEECLEYVGNPIFMDNLIQGPDELWQIENNLKQNIFSFIKKFKDSSGADFYLCAFSLLYRSRASFIILATATYHRPYYECFKLGQKINDPQGFLMQKLAPSSGLDKETIERVERKKSKYLAQLIDLKESSDKDIGLEEYQEYEKYFKDTMEKPDEIYRNIDSEKDEVMIYIKAHEKDHESFFYFILFFVAEMEMEKGEKKKQLIPIISFPSSDGVVYGSFKMGAPLKVRENI